LPLGLVELSAGITPNESLNAPGAQAALAVSVPFTRIERRAHLDAITRTLQAKSETDATGQVGLWRLCWKSPKTRSCENHLNSDRYLHSTFVSPI